MRMGGKQNPQNEILRERKMMEERLKKKRKPTIIHWKRINPKNVKLCQKTQQMYFGKSFFIILLHKWQSI